MNLTPSPAATDPSASAPAVSGPLQHAALHGVCRLDDWGLIAARGEEARKFLHGQLTQDMEHLPASTARLAGYCSPKGRLLATLVVWRQAPEAVFLACSADVLPATLKRLSMFVLRAKCKLSDATAELPLWGLAGAAAAQAFGAAAAELPEWGHAQVLGGDLVRLPDGQDTPRYLFAGPALPAEASIPALALEHWRWLEVHSGVARVVGATVEKFVPQMVNLELVGGVNFQKGCYPGQEIVARSQYRGTLKRRAYVVYGERPLQPGQELLHSEDATQPAGMVVLSGSLGAHEHAALVELKVAALSSGTLHAGALPGAQTTDDPGADALLGRPLTVGALPYTLPAPELA